jgi:hypothetical protein
MRTNIISYVFASNQPFRDFPLLSISDMQKNRHILLVFVRSDREEPDCIFLYRMREKIFSILRCQKKKKKRERNNRRIFLKSLVPSKNQFRLNTECISDNDC